LPITKAYIEQNVVNLALRRVSVRGIVAFISIAFDYPIPIGTVQNIVIKNAKKARTINEKYDLSKVNKAAYDEIFQGNKPILTIVDIETYFLALLSLEDSRDADTWGLRLLECKD